MNLGDALVALFNMLTNTGSFNTGALLQSPAEYNHVLYAAAIVIHNGAVKPVTSIVLSIIAVLMLATNAQRIEGDRELGVRIIAATMFKVAMVLVACSSAVLILDGISQVATTITHSASTLNVGAGAGTGQPLGDQMKGDLEGADTVTQLGMLAVMLLPFIAVCVAGAVAAVMVFIRFLQMYILTAFASLPVAFLAHEDTKTIGIGYLKRYATTAFTGVVIVVAVKFYQALLGGWLGSNIAYKAGGDLWTFIFQNFGTFLISPIVLIFLIFTANGLAKAIVGEG